MCRGSDVAALFTSRPASTLRLLRFGGGTGRVRGAERVLDREMPTPRGLGGGGGGCRARGRTNPSFGALGRDLIVLAGERVAGSAGDSGSETVAIGENVDGNLEGADDKRLATLIGRWGSGRDFAGVNGDPKVKDIRFSGDPLERPAGIGGTGGTGGRELTVPERARERGTGVCGGCGTGGISRGAVSTGLGRLACSARTCRRSSSCVFLLGLFCIVEGAATVEVPVQTAG